MENKFKSIKFVLVLLALALSIGLINAEASLQISSFSCSPSEVSINSVFSCTAQITNTGDTSGYLETVTLYADTNNWLESSTYAQSSGVTLNTSQSTEITFTGLRATKSGNNGFQKLMLDTVERTDYVSTTKVNVINVAVTISNSASSAAMSGSVTSTAEVTAGGNVNIILAFAADSGGCSIGSQTNPVTFNEMTDGSKQSKVWTITQGTSGNCQFTVSASATGTGGIVSKIDSTSSTITCTDCPSGGSSSSSSGGSGSGGVGGGSGASVYYIGELVSSASKEIAKNEKIKFGISGKNHTITLKNLTETSSVIEIESKKQTFTLTVGSDINVDLDDDGNSDINIKLTSINLLTKKANFVLILIPQGTNVKPSTEDNAANPNAVKNEGELSEQKASNNLWIYLIIGLVIIALIAIIYIFMRKKGNYRNKRKYY